jgi:hypothetical protein
VPVLLEDAKGATGNPWGVSMHTRIWHMTEDSAWFRTASQLRESGFVREDADWVRPEGLWPMQRALEARGGGDFRSLGLDGSAIGDNANRFVPLYEAKMIHQFDHRWATYDGADSRDVTLAEKADHSFEPTPRYWVPELEVRDRLSVRNWTRRWLIGLRSITNSTNERTVIAGIWPYSGAGNSCQIWVIDNLIEPMRIAALYGSMSSITLDYIARQKVGGTDLNVFYVAQFPVPPPRFYTDSDLAFIVPRVLELTYTSHNMAPFARDLGYNGPPFAWDEDRRALLRAELDAWYARADARRIALHTRPGRHNGTGLPVRDLPRAEEQREGALRGVSHRPSRARRLGCAGGAAGRRPMIPPEDPPGFVVRTEAQKAAWDNGFRLERGVESGSWLRYTSTTAHGEIWIAGAPPRGPWLLSIDHPGVAAELATLPPSPLPGPGIATFGFDTLTALHAALDRVYKLGVSLPDAPLARFRAQTADLPQTTEVERLVLQRIGQEIFRAALMDYWGARCPVTGITDLALLRASHIVPWAECGDSQRLDVHNGLLLSALWDAAFDVGLVSFANDGTVLASPELSTAARTALGIEKAPRLPNLRDAHRANLAAHRARHGFSGISSMSVSISLSTNSR